MISDPFFYACAIPAVLLVGLAKGGFGGSVTLAGVPLMALAVPPVTAAGILLPILIAMDIVGLLAWRGTFDRHVLRIMLPAAILGILFGFLTASLIPASGVRLTIGLLALWFALDWFLVSRNRTQRRTQDPLRGGIWGAVSGFASFVSHAGGPPFQVYVLPLKLDPALYAGTSVVFFAVMNAVKLVPYFLLGQFSPANLATSAVLLPIAPVATLAGVWLVKRIRPTAFYWITYSLLAPVGAKLVWDGARDLLG